MYFKAAAAAKLNTTNHARRMAPHVHGDVRSRPMNSFSVFHTAGSSPYNPHATCSATRLDGMIWSKGSSTAGALFFVTKPIPLKTAMNRTKIRPAMVAVCMSLAIAAAALKIGSMTMPTRRIQQKKGPKWPHVHGSSAKTYMTVMKIPFLTNVTAMSRSKPTMMWANGLYKASPTSVCMSIRSSISCGTPVKPPNKTPISSMFNQPDITMMPSGVLCAMPKKQKPRPAPSKSGTATCIPMMTGSLSMSVSFLRPTSCTCPRKLAENWLLRTFGILPKHSRALCWSSRYSFAVEPGDANPATTSSTMFGNSSLLNSAAKKSGCAPGASGVITSNR
mmetsp:Transcript_48649/g.125325  ORF Transcript_48649/g.125325 Transcript_48649/m.125325 type:complete len:334 (-) Transcript_48649:746-1747(-)